MSDNTDTIFKSFKIETEGRAQTEDLNTSQSLTMEANTIYNIIVANTDVIITLSSASTATKGAFAYFKLTKTGTGNAIINSASSMGGSTSQTISVNNEGFGLIDEETSYAIDRNTRLDLSSLWDQEYVVSTSPSPITITKEKASIVDSSSFEANIQLPDVNGNKEWYGITLSENGNHCNITTVSGQLIGGLAVISLSTVNSGLIIKGNGLTGVNAAYDIIADNRPRYRTIPFSADLNLSSGFESEGNYEGSPADATTITVTIKDWVAEHRGDRAFFYKSSGVNSSIRVVSQNGTDFDQTLTEDGTRFEVIAGYTGYILGQDNRPNPIAATVNYYPIDLASTLEIVLPYKQLLTSQSDPNYPPVTIPFLTDPITVFDDLNPQSLGFFIDDGGILRGFLSERNITAIAQVALSVVGNRTAKFKFKYYSYDIGTTTLEAQIAETGYSEAIISDIHTTKLVAGVLSDFNWTGKTLVIELLGFKSATGGDNPILSYNSGGDTPSLTTVNIPATSMAHNSLSEVQDASSGAEKGHVNNKKPLQFPELDAADFASLLPGEKKIGMRFFDTDEERYKKYDGTNAVPDDDTIGAPVTLVQSTSTLNIPMGEVRILKVSLTEDVTTVNYNGLIAGTEGSIVWVEVTHNTFTITGFPVSTEFVDFAQVTEDKARYMFAVTDATTPVIELSINNITS